MKMLVIIGNSYPLHDYSIGMDSWPNLTLQMAERRNPNHPFVLNLVDKKDPSELYGKII